MKHTYFFAQHQYLMYVIIFCIIFSGCKKKETAEEEVAVPVVLAEYHFKANINGTDFVYEIKSGNNTNMLSISDNQNFNGMELFRFGAEMDATSAPANLGYPVVGISFQTLKQLTTDVTDADFFGFLKKGNYNYLNTFVLGDNGVVVQLVDRNGNFFYSTDGPQPAATFTVDIATPKAATIGNVAKVKVRALFNCKVYNAVGGTLDIKDGELVIDIENPY